MHHLDAVADRKKRVVLDHNQTLIGCEDEVATVDEAEGPPRHVERAGLVEELLARVENALGQELHV
jgi:hypothetical protein